MGVNTGDPVLNSCVTHNASHGSGRESLAVLVAEQCSLSAHGADPGRQSARSGRPKRNHTIPTAFALANGHQELLQVDVRHIQSDRLADPDA